MASALEQLAAAGPDGGEVHEHLLRECPWYRHVHGGGADEPAKHCRRPEASGGALVKLTPRTPEASTAVKPTVPPGGPGLFHVKGLHLPPYIEHLYPHLVARYGKHDAYGVAVGIVKKWKEGVNPGGKHPSKTHPDVRAAAARNVAEWEADRARGHAHRGHDDKVKATSANPAPGLPYQGQKQSLLPPVPKAARAMYTAHRLNNVLNYLAHAEERLGAAKAGKGLRAYHMIHVNNHLSNSLDDLRKLVESLQLNYPAEYKELQALTRTMGLAKAEGTDAKAATFAHLLQTILYHLAHAKRHALVMGTPDPDALWQFNWDHASVHVKGALEHGFKLARHLKDNYPAEGKWLQELVDVEDPSTDFTGLAAGPGAATAPGTRPFTPPPQAAGKLAQYGLYQKPSQTVSPSPPLPPDVPLPTAAEVRALLPLVPDCSDVSLATTIRKFLDVAAVKLEKDAPLEALSALRGTQAAVLSAHKADVRYLPAAYVFTRVPSAEQSSALADMKQSRARVLAYRKLDLQVGWLADRIRKKYFHGLYNGPSQQARLGTGDSDMTAVEKLMALAGPVTGKDVSEPVVSDTTGSTPLLQPPENLDAVTGEAAREMAAMTALDKTRITAYIAKAREMRESNPAGAAQFLARAKVIAFEAGARHLGRHLHHHIQALADTRNATSTDERWVPPQARNSPDSPSAPAVRLAARLR